MFSQVQLHIHTPLSLTAELSDALLSYPAGLVFNTSLIRVYQLDPNALTAKEQVLGYQQMARYSITLHAVDVDTLLTYLRNNLFKTNLHYEVTPIVQQGNL